MDHQPNLSSETKHQFVTALPLTPEPAGPAREWLDWSKAVPAQLWWRNTRSIGSHESAKFACLSCF